jgi:hypothetical protein
VSDVDVPGLFVSPPFLFSFPEPEPVPPLASKLQTLFIISCNNCFKV